MIIGFTGHRDKTTDPDNLLQIEKMYPGATWLHGGAKGFDTQVNTIGLELGKVPEDSLVVLRPDYDKYAYKVAPLMRNRVIVENCDLLVVCWDSRTTGGTYYTLCYANKLGIKTHHVACLPVLTTE